MTKKSVLPPFFVLLFAANAILARQSGDALRFDVAAAQFRVNDSLNLAEFYLSIPRSALQFAPVDSGIQAQVDIQLRVYKHDALLHKEKWRLVSKAASRDELAASQVLLSQKQLQMKAGVYRIETTVQDHFSLADGSHSFTFTVVPFQKELFASSDIQLASRIERAEAAGGKFYKNGYDVIPNPSETFGSGLPALFFYLEIYNLDFPSDSSYSVSWRVLDRDDQIVKDFPAKLKPVAGRSVVEVGGFNVMTLKSGGYTLIVKIRDIQGGRMMEKIKLFRVVREIDRSRAIVSAQQISSGDLADFYYRDKSPKEIEDEFSAVKWIASKNDERIFKRLDLAGKKNFLARFWHMRDPDSTRLTNAFRDDYLRRVQYAVVNFGGMKPGWRTDRGRVMLVYGRPDEIERHPSNNSLRAYQVWYFYKLQGGVEFIFVDIRGWGEMELVNATARNEINNPDWQRWLRPTGQ